jgi:hypothetical protein
MRKPTKKPANAKVRDLARKPLTRQASDKVKGGMRGGKDRTQTEDDVYIGNR